MKLLSVKLVNYIGIANGTGRHEIYIDFTACKPIIAVVGHNGSGKSTLLKALHPFPDSYDVLIPNLDGYKELRYIKDNHLYEIRIHYIHTENKNSTEVAIFKDNVNLNPTLNVTSAKDIIMNEFELDSNYITLSQLSSEDRGLADKRPSERKKFVNDILADLTVYNTMYKTLNKKSSTFKNLMSNLSYKINNIGGDNLPLLESTIQQLEVQLKSLEKQKEETIAEQTTLNNAMDLNKELSEECIRIKNQYQLINQAHDDVLDQINQFKTNAATTLIVDWEPKDLSTLGKEACDKLNAELIVLNTKYETSHNLYDSATKKYQTEISEKNIKQNQLNSLDNIHLDKFTIELKEIEKKKNTMEAELVEASDILLKSRNNSTIVHALYDDLYDCKSEMYSLVYYHNANDIKELGDIDFVKNKISELKASLLMNQNTYDNLIKDGISFSNIDHLEDIPDNCENKTCYFCKIKDEYLKVKDQLICQNTEKDRLQSEIDRDTAQLNLYKDYLHELNIINRYQKILSRNSRLIEEIDSITKLKRSDIFVQDITMLAEAVLSITHLYNILDGYNHIKGEHAKLLENYISLSDNLQIAKGLKKDIEIHNKNIKQYQNEANILAQEVQSIETEIQNVTTQLNDVKMAYEFGVKFDEIQVSLLQCKAEYDKREDTIKKMIILETKLKNATEKLNGINKDIDNVKQNCDNNKYNARMLKEYKQEYDLYVNDYQKIETIKRFTSPTTGIQTLFMETYMNNVLVIANQLLALMFNGEFVLQPFIINENEFRIPCAGSGYLNDDISSMSTSQICIISMIISFAMLYNSSSCYNIIRLDEIDGGLDVDNRIKFIEMLDQIMNIMHCEQCFIISHNMELDESQVTKIDMNSF